LFDRPKPTAGCSASGRRRRIYIYNCILSLYRRCDYRVHGGSVFLWTSMFVHRATWRLFLKCGKSPYSSNENLKPHNTHDIPTQQLRCFLCCKTLESAQSGVELMLIYITCYLIKVCYSQLTVNWKAVKAG
jgi:hypothetical protein